VPAVQPSATVELQVEQPLPPVPQDVAPAVRQVVPLQQPLPHEVASHVHVPLTQCWPAAQGAPLPHAHPPEEQESALIGSQATQATPPVPHVPADGELHVLPVQQPVVHVEAQLPHTPPVQVSPVPHGVQAAPPVPHAPVEGAVLQALLAQHPEAQEVASQTHAPPTQCWPAAHAAPLPHAQLPPLLHESARTASHATQAVPVAPAVPHCESDCAWHTPPTQQPSGHDEESQTQPLPVQCCPAAQAAPVPHLQVPPVQESDSCASQATHEAPPVPHVPVPDVVQVVPLQHPVGQDIASQTHCPPRQRCPEPHAA
jgi:hypothetical protein